MLDSASFTYGLSRSGILIPFGYFVEIMSADI